MKRPKQFHWQEIEWFRPFDFTTVQDFIGQLSGFTHRQPFIWEIHIKPNNIKYYLGTEVGDGKYLKKMMSQHHQVRFEDINQFKREKPSSALNLNVKHSYFSLKLDTTENMTRSTLALCKILKPEESVVLQVIVGRSRAPKPIPKELYVNPTWWQCISGNIPKLSADSEKLVKEKLRQAQFQTSVRVGIRGKDKVRDNLIRKTLLSSLRILDSNGASIEFTRGSAHDFHYRKIPWHFPTILSTSELANLFLLPAGENELAGVPSLAPKTILPPIGMKRQSGLQLAESLGPKPIPLAIRPLDLLSHLHLLGGTGAGKSTVMLNLILQVIGNGHSTVVIDPKGDLIRDVLESYPRERDEDLVLLDPSMSGRVVGINPFELTKFGVSEGLVADMLLTIFRELFPDHFGIRTLDVLSHSFLTLAKIEEANLAMLAPLLTNKAFRQKIISDISDPFLLNFWQGFETMSQSDRNLLISPVLNKMRQILLRPELRAIFGQSQTNFSLIELFVSRKVLLIPLNRGLLGTENAKFITAIVVGCLWQLTLQRASIPPEKRHYIYFFLDELAEFIKLPTSVDDALSMSRSLGVGWILANQFLKQLPVELRQSIKTNCKNRLVFGLSMNEAKNIASETIELKAEDFHALPAFQVYAKMPLISKEFRWVSGSTLPPPVKFRGLTTLYAKSLARYGANANEVEANFKQIFKENTILSAPPPDRVGRQKRKKEVTE